SHDKVDSLLNSNAADAEDRSDIYDADPAHFQVVTSQLRRGRHQFAALERFHPGDVVRHQAITPFDQAEHTLAFSNAAWAADQDAYPQNVDHAAELGHSGGKIDLHRNRGGIDKSHCHHRRPEN